MKNTSEILKIIISTLPPNSIILLNLALITAIYGYQKYSIPLLLLSGLITNGHNSFSKIDYEFIKFISIISITILIAEVISFQSENLISNILHSIFSVYFFILLRNNIEHIEYIFLTILVCFLISSLNLIALYIEGTSIQSTEIVNNSFTNIFIVPNDYAFFIILLPYCTSIVKNIKDFKAGLIVSSLYTIATLTSVILNSRLCLLLLVILILLDQGGKLKNKLLLGSILSIVIGIVVFTMFPEFASKMYSLPTSRIPLWEAAIYQIKLNPLFGVGDYSFENIYKSHIEATTYGGSIIVDSRGMPWPHNLFLEIILNFGIVTLVILMLLTADLMKRTYGSSEISACALKSFLIFFVASFFELSFIRLYPQLIFIFTISILVASKSISFLKNDREIEQDFN